MTIHLTASPQLITHRPTFSGQVRTGIADSGMPIHHTRQSDLDSCAVIALRDLFAYYGLAQEAVTLQNPIRKLLSNILTQGPQGVNTHAMRQAFETFPPQMYGSFDIARVITTANQTGKLHHLVCERPDGGRKAITTATLLLFMAECGMAPKTLQLNQPDDLAFALNRLASGHPVIFMESGVEPLISRVQQGKAPITNHMFILHKPTTNSPVLLYDINDPNPVLVPENQLEATLGHPKTQAIIVQNISPTIPAHLLGAPSVAIPL